MKKIIILTALFLILLPFGRSQAKSKVPELTFEETVETMVREHKIMLDRLIAAKEHLAAYYTGAVVMNRVNSKYWPNTVKDVLYQKNPRQYSTTEKFFTKEIPEECYEMARDIYKNGTPDVPYNVVFQATFKQGRGDWIDPINGEHFCYGRA